MPRRLQGEADLPIVVKPTHTWVQEHGEGQRLRAMVAGSYAEAIAATCTALAQGGTEVMLQEWLPGDREAISFMCAHDRIWARFAQRADRTLPPLGGNSILRESIPLPPDVTPAAEQLVLEIGLDGYSEVEFRRGADGRAALMEINPRLSASVEIAVRAGVPFPRLLHALGERRSASKRWEAIVSAGACAGWAAISRGSRRRSDGRASPTSQQEPMRCRRFSVIS